MRGRWEASSGGSGWRPLEAAAVEPVSLRVTGPGEGWVTRDGKVVRAAWSTDATGTWITVDGRTVLFRRAPAEGAGGREGSLTSPMPAKVLRLAVAPGDVVREGDVLMVLEAMKMEHAIKAPRDGTVNSVAAREGEQVAAGVTLVDLE